MGHRASIAYVYDDGAVQAHYSHWGAHDLSLVDEITPEAPFGGASNEPEFVTALKQALSAEAEANDDTEIYFGDDASGSVDPEPYGDYDSLESWAHDGIDFLFHEAAYVVHTDPWEVTGYDTMQYLGSDENDVGLLVEIDADEWMEYSSAVREWPSNIDLDEFEEKATTLAGDRIPDWSLAGFRRHK